MVDSDITVYGAYWCPDCRRRKMFLGELQIPYNWIDLVESQAGREERLPVDGAFIFIGQIPLYKTSKKILRGLSAGFSKDRIDAGYAFRSSHHAKF